MLTRIGCSALVPLLALLLGACTGLAPRPDGDFLTVNGSLPPFPVAGGTVLTDNDMALGHKLDLIDGARERIDLAYYIHSDDYSSSVLNQALLEAARRGVQVRMLLDYHSNYQHLDLYRMLEARGDGRIQVRLFNRPTVNIIRDAAYLSLGCAAVGATTDPGQCDEAKLAAIDAQLAASTDPRNANVAGSGLVLAGLYGKDPRLLASAILEGQQLDPTALQSDAPDPEQRARLQEFLQLYWDARFGNAFERLLAGLQLDLAFTLYGAELTPVRDALESYLPLGRRDADDDTLRDWDYLTDFLHHKLLLMDDRALILGGRNVEDAYHMVPNALTERYVFKDVDLHLELDTPQPALGESFERLWNFREMVASIDEVVQHAPIEPLLLARAERERCADTAEASEARRQCLEALATEFADLDARLAQIHRQMQQHADTYRRRYLPAPPGPARPSFPVDAGAVAYYLENLPIVPGSAPPRRQYGAQSGGERTDAKHIHAAWRAALRDVCQRPGPQRVVIHNAYFFLPANIREDLAAMLSGRWDCADTEIVILTNSPRTTDLNVINVAAGYSLRALGEYLGERASPQAARLRFYEYQPLADPGAPSTVSFHAKVMLFGDDIFIGSANADVRSFMMDTNNGVYLRNAPRLAAAYRDWIDTMLADPEQTRELTAEHLGTPVAERLPRDLAFLDGELARRGWDRRLTPEQGQQLRDRVEEILLDIHRLASEALRGGREAERRFDERFKVL